MMTLCWLLSNSHNIHCAKSTCSEGQYLDWNSCKGRILKITIRNAKISAPFPTEACTVSDDNKLILWVGKNWWDEEKELSACTTGGSFIFTGASSYYFRWWIKETKDLLGRSINYWPTNNLTYAISRDRDAPFGFDFEWYQLLPDNFTIGEVVIENMNVPRINKFSDQNTKERFNESIWSDITQDIESLDKIKQEYDIKSDLSFIKCRFTKDKNHGFDHWSNTKASIIDTNYSKEIKDHINRDGISLSENIKERTIIFWTNFNYAAGNFRRDSGTQRHRYFNDRTYGNSKDNLYLWFVHVTNSEVNLYRFPISCNIQDGYIWPDIKSLRGFPSDRLFAPDVSIMIGNHKWSIKYK